PCPTQALRKALGDRSRNVRLSAATALAVAGDASGKDLVAKLLDPQWVQENVVDVPSGESSGERDAELVRSARFGALSNGLRGALGLRADDLKPKVEALARDGDEDVRAVARDVLDRWGKPR